MAFVEIRDNKFKNRVLYPNPVVILETERNVMILSWLTPINNAGDFLLSINKKRFSNQFVTQSGAHFKLHVATFAIKEVLLKIGSCSGANVHKISTFKELKPIRIKVINPSNKFRHQTSDQEPSTFEHCAAILDCETMKVEKGDIHHDIVFAKINGCFVRPEYWTGTKFISKSSKEEDQILSFLGSQTFAKIIY